MLAIGGIIAYRQYGKVQLVSTKASYANTLNWEVLEPESTVSAKIYRTTTDFLEDPDDQYLVATVAYPTTTFTDTHVSNGVTYYYSVFLVDETGATFDPSYFAMAPVDVAGGDDGGGGGGGGGGGSSGGSGGGSGGGSPNIPPPTPTSGTRLINSNGTYYFISGGFRRGITSPGIMYACGFEFKDAKAATASDLAVPTSLLLPCDGSLVKSREDQTVYLISSNKRYAFTSASVFTGLGFKFSSVLIVTNPELQALAKANDLNDSKATHLPGTDINMSGTVYWIDGNMQKHAYPSLEVYNTWHRDGDFTTVVPANANDSNLTTGSNVSARAF